MRFEFIRVWGVTILILVAVAAGGCASSIDARIRERPAAFADATPAQQISIRQGRVEEGYTPDMVYFALGRPSKVDGRTWTYRNYFPDGQALYADDLSDPTAGRAPRSGETGGTMGGTLRIQFADGIVVWISTSP